MGTTPPGKLKPRRAPRQARSSATVDAILEATIQVLLGQGARRLTTTRVAERAGVSVGTLYQYFPHKQGLLYAVIQRYLNEVAEAVDESCQRTLGQPIDVASDMLVAAYVDAKGAHAEASRALYLVSAELDVADLVNAIFARLRHSATRLLERAPDASFEDVDEIAFALLAAVTGATRVFFEHEFDPAKLAAFRHQIMLISRTFLSSVSNATQGG